MVFIPKLVSEREGSAWEDCTWASGVMFGNALEAENVHPASRTEYEGLRYDATGVREAEGDGSTMAELEVGLVKRYGFFRGAQFERVSGYDGLRPWLFPGSCAAIQLLYAKWPERLRITTYKGGHAVAIVVDEANDPWVGDPLNVNGAAWKRVSRGEIKAAMDAFPGAQSVVGRIGGAERTNPMLKLDLERFTVPKGTIIYEFPGGPRVATFSAAADVTTIGVPMQSNGTKQTGWRALWRATAALDGVSSTKLGYIKTSGLTRLPADSAWEGLVRNLMTQGPIAVPAPVPAPPDPAALVAAFNDGVTTAADAAAATKRT